MNFKMIHENYNVFDLQKSIAFYEKALGLTEKRRKEAPDRPAPLLLSFTWAARSRILSWS